MLYYVEEKLIYSHIVMSPTQSQLLTDGVIFKKAKPPKVKQENIVERKHKNKTDVLSLEFKAWNYIDEVNIDTLLEHGGLITGMAGTGKSTHLNIFKAKLTQQKRYSSPIMRSMCAYSQSL